MVHRRIIDARIERPSRGMRPAKILKMLRRALDDVIRLGLPQESGAIAADIFRCFYPDADKVGDLAKDVQDRLDSRLSMPDVAERSSLYQPVRGALEAVREFCRRQDAWRRPGRLREVIEGLRTSAGAGPQVVTCLIPWPSVSPS
jgi:hypothetical protein